MKLAKLICKMIGHKPGDWHFDETPGKSAWWECNRCGYHYPPKGSSYEVQWYISRVPKLSPKQYIDRDDPGPRVGDW